MENDPGLPSLPVGLPDLSGGFNQHSRKQLSSIGFFVKISSPYLLFPLSELSFPLFPNDWLPVVFSTGT